MKVVDSHVHLYSRSHLAELAWMTPGHALARDCRLAEYVADARGLPPGRDLAGIVFVEADRVQSAADWSGPENEFAFAGRCLRGQLAPDEGPNAHADLVVGVVPWAPLPQGPAAMEAFVAALKERDAVAFESVKGFRYLVQDKPPGVMTAPAFVESLRWMGERGLAFDVGIDLHRAGPGQFVEAVAMVSAAPDTTYVFNHLGKPVLTALPAPGDGRFAAWRAALAELAGFRTYVKLSGVFAELPPGAADETALALVYPWVAAVFELFGPERVLWASDWPVCTVEGGADSVGRWARLTDALLRRLGVDAAGQAMVWHGAAARAYRLV
ncbi:uncharacterized protein V1510DRAFT_155409 [Dipodascopsis tothii]|uniref:uncharacterized protein n=1 Tax=Dipodascopsis tothii TaxID=44089 RepID=UPI0034CDF975